jgi:hypothetical protein
MARKLDKNRKYGQIFGIHEYGAVFQQDGACFNGVGDEVGPGVSAVVADPLRPGAAGPVPTAPVVAAAPAPTVDFEAELNNLHPAQVSKLMSEAGLVPRTGPGSKKDNIAMLLAQQGA